MSEESPERPTQDVGNTPDIGNVSGMQQHHVTFKVSLKSTSSERVLFFFFCLHSYFSKNKPTLNRSFRDGNKFHSF